MRPARTIGTLADGYQTGAQVTAAGGQIAAGAVAATTTAATAAVAVPIIGAAVLGVTLMLNSIARRNAQKTAATRIVNEVEPQLEANVQAYMNGPRTRSSQRQALANFDLGWSMVRDNCSDPALGSAGQRCISERQAGGIAPWCTTPDKRGCDWFTLYRNPIESDPHVTDDPISNTVSELFPSLTAAELQAISPNIIPALALLALVILL